MHISSAAGFVLQRLLNKSGSAASPLLLLQWDGAVWVPRGSPKQSMGSRSGRMGTTSERQLLSRPQSTLVPEEPRAQSTLQQQREGTRRVSPARTVLSALHGLGTAG